MPESDPEEESFTFVDKRKAGGGDAAAAHTVASAIDEPDPVDLDSLSADLESEDSLHDPKGAYALAAYVLGLIASEAWQRMGLIADPATGKVNKDLDQARFSIDCVSALADVFEQHGAAVPSELRRDLQRVLGDLRLNYVEQARR